MNSTMPMAVGPFIAVTLTLTGFVVAVSEVASAETGVDSTASLEDATSDSEETAPLDEAEDPHPTSKAAERETAHIIEAIFFIV